ncbi:MAG: SIS domain-containing protein [Planctomycetota bacterium]|nr:MAG: SIS domain-containing protein [Planctomycetota bacterium]
MSGDVRNWSDVLAEHVQVAERMASLGESLDRVAAMLIQKIRDDHRIFVLGNGGSAADAQHIATELLGRFKRDRRALPALALTTDTSALTAVGNDLGFEQVFARQVRGLVRAGDVVWILSTSGNSPNVVAAAVAARQSGAVVVGFTGRGGGKLAEHCDHLIRIDHDSSDRIQEGHELAYHYLCERVEAALADSR